MSDIRDSDQFGSSLERATIILRQGGIVAFPTETFYGLAVDPFCEPAVARLFKVKHRPAHKPLLLLVDRLEQLLEVAAEIPLQYRELMEKFWPGPLTLIFPARKDLPSLITADTGTVGVRISPHPIARQLIRLSGRPITATSANLADLQPAKTAHEVQAMFQNELDYIFDGGETAAGQCSTIVGLEGGKLTLVRRGQIDAGPVFGKP